MCLLYVYLYSVGRFLVETLRIDAAFVVGSSTHGNLFVSGVLTLQAPSGSCRGPHMSRCKLHAPGKLQQLRLGVCDEMCQMADVTNFGKS